MSAISILLHLTFTNCYPVLLYGLEACKLSRRQIRSLTYAYNSCFFKLFRSFDTGVIQQCQFFSGHLPFTYAMDLKVLNFLYSLADSAWSPAETLFRLVGQEELAHLELKYGVNAQTPKGIIKNKIWALFQAELIIP